MSTLAIGYFGDGPWASRALEALAQVVGLQVRFIVPRYDTRDPELDRWAKKLGVPFLPIENVNDPMSIAELGAFACDLFVSMSFNQILRSPILQVPRLGFINCHAGRLPFYRGRNPLNWVLINGETEFGVTVHWVDQGIDTGDIILQKRCPIEPNDTYADLLERAHVVCADVLVDAVKGLQRGTAGRVDQASIHPVGTYFSRRRPGDEWINWSWPSQRVHDLVRAISSPGPGAVSELDGRPIIVESTALVTDAVPYIATDGEVVGRSTGGALVKTGDTIILVTGVRCIGSKDVEVPRWPIGTRLAGMAEARLSASEAKLALLEQRLDALEAKLNGMGPVT